MHPKLGVMLVVYVDDFKMAGPKENLSKAWDLVKSKIKMEEAAPIKRYLGCEHVQFEHTVSGAFDPRMKWTQDEKPRKKLQISCLARMSCCCPSLSSILAKFA